MDAYKSLVWGYNNGEEESNRPGGLNIQVRDTWEGGKRIPGANVVINGLGTTSVTYIPGRLEVYYRVDAVYTSAGSLSYGIRGRVSPRRPGDRAQPGYVLLPEQAFARSWSRWNIPVNTIRLKEAYAQMKTNLSGLWSFKPGFAR